MNSIHNNGKNNGSLNEGLDKLSHAYGQLQQDEPPELLDQAILNSAHRALEKKPHWMKFGWLHGLTTAAVFVLAFSIILNQRETIPDYKTGMKNNEPIRLQREKSAKKQSAVQLDGLRMEKKVKSENQQEALQSMPVTATPVSVAKEVAPEDSAARAQRSLYVRESLQGKTGSIDKDAPTSALMAEDEFLEESDLLADDLEVGSIHKQSLPATIAEPAASEAKARAKTDSKLEQRLLAIIKLKQSGDETWKTELESFKESYPDYPLPNELKVP